MTWYLCLLLYATLTHGLQRRLEPPSLSLLRPSPLSIQLQRRLVSRKLGIKVMNAVNLVPIRCCKGTRNKGTLTQCL
jgi:hypothetical protein